MAVEYNHQDYTTGKQILVFPDHYVCVAQTFNQNDAAAVTVDGRKIIKAGTIWPSNDANALGVVFNDLDVTNGDQNGALLIHGFVNPSKLPVLVSSEAVSAMRGVEFVGMRSYTGLRVRSYPDAVRKEYDGSQDQILDATGVNVTIVPSSTPNVDYDINISGIAPLISSEVVTALGYESDITNVAVYLVQIPDVTGIFDVTKVKYNGSSITIADCVYIDGIWYLSIAKGLKAVNGVISGGSTNFTIAYGDADAKTFAQKYVGLTLQTA